MLLRGLFSILPILVRIAQRELIRAMGVVLAVNLLDPVRGNVSGHILGSYYAKFWGPNIMPRRANRTQFCSGFASNCINIDK